MRVQVKSELAERITGASPPGEEHLRLTREQEEKLHDELIRRGDSLNDAYYTASRTCPRSR